MKSQAFAVVEPSNYVGIIPLLIEYSITMELNENLQIVSTDASCCGNNTRLSFNAA